MRPGGLCCVSNLRREHICGERAGVPRSLTTSSPAETTPASSRSKALRFLRFCLVAGSKRPIRLKSPRPVSRAIRILASSTVASWGSSTEAGSFLMGFLGARLESLSDSWDAIVVPSCSLPIQWQAVEKQRNCRGRVLLLWPLRCEARTNQSSQQFLDAGPMPSLPRSRDRCSSTCCHCQVSSLDHLK